MDWNRSPRAESSLGDSLLDVFAENPAAKGSIVFPESGEVMNRRELFDRADAVAGELLKAGAEPGDVVGLLLPTSPAFPPALLGVLSIGAAASVLPLPAVGRDVDAVMDGLASFVRTARIRHLVVARSLTPLLGPLLDRCAGLQLVEAERCGVGGRRRKRTVVRAADTAIVQFTSGSTVNPKGVSLSHGALLHSVLAPIARGGMSDRDVGYQWVPLFHDFGLIGLLIALCAGFDTHLVGPATFIRNPGQALRYFSEHGVTICTGPNFAYERLVRAVRTEDMTGVDLSRWRLALNGGEPVSPATVRRFGETLGGVGVPATAMTPAYGMAEFVAGITIDEPARPPRITTVDRSSLVVGRRVEVGRSGWVLVSQGRPLPGIEVRVVGADDSTLPDGWFGELEARGASLMDGYVGDPAASAAALHDGWLRTGDRGFLHDGEVHVAGRSKEMIIVSGRNIHAEEAEAIAGDVTGVYQRHCVAVADHDRERLVLVAETTDPDTAAVRRRVQDAVSAGLGVSDVTVRTVGKGWLPRTTSGKWRRGEVRNRLQAEVVR